ncbi:MAG: N-acetylmuramoyl-L-alanine amidase [Eubacteriales bacterium]
MKKSITCVAALLLAILTACGDVAAPTDTTKGSATDAPAVTSPIVTSPTDRTTSASPETTKSPETSGKPETTKSPETSGKPETTKSPETSGKPETTKSPETSGKPETTESPTTSDKPTTTEPPQTADTPTPATPLSAMEFAERRILYTLETVTLSTADGQQVAVLGANCTVLAVKTEDGAEKILYRGWLCEMNENAFTSEVPVSILAKQNELGGIYYPSGDRLVAVDAGHQGTAMKDKEPLGPGSTELKAMISSGTAGVSTRIAERELNLRVSMLLRDELLSRGYSVLMIRESHDVTISNAQRALIANAYGADAFVRVHANGSTDSTVRGAMTICQTEDNPYNGELYGESFALSECILDEYCAVTGIKRNNVWRTDTMTGINWATVPVTIVEMGYMSNAEEDELMATDAFRKSAAIGIANGLDAFFKR